MAQLVAQRTLNPLVVSSNLTAGTMYGSIVKWLSQQTFNLPVPGSSPGAPTISKHIRDATVVSVRTREDKKPKCIDGLIQRVCLLMVM